VPKDKNTQQEPIVQQEPQAQIIQLTTQQLDELLINAIRKALEPLTKVDRKHGVFPGADSPEDVAKLSRKERSLKFIKAVFMNDLAEIRALSEGTSTAGGYLVPEEFRAEVIRLIPNYGLARKLCRVVPMTRDKMNFPKAGATGVTAYWVSENGQITESTPNFGQIQLDTKKCAGIAGLSNEFVDDAEVDVLDYLFQLFAEAIAGGEDTQWLTGTGSPITGILGGSSVNVVTMGAGMTAFANITADNLSDLPNAVSGNSEANGAYFMHKNILNYVRKLKDDNGQYIWQAPAGSQPGTIWGYPYHITDVMPGTAQSAVATKFVAFGDPKYTLFGDRKQVSIKIAEEATVGSNKLFEQDMKALRVIERVDIQLAIEEAYACLKTAAV